MKKLLYIFSIISLAFGGCYSTSQVAGTDDGYYNNDDYNNSSDNYYSSANSYNRGPLNYQVFYNELSPYGNWINYPGHGYVWVPGVGSSFSPYETNGHWVSTVDGWAWASNYNWGWAPFHYGRWMRDPQIGWAWVPGYEWAPAWVQWGRYNNNYAWAPLGPGANIGYGSSYMAPSNYWCMLPYNYMNRSNIDRHIVRSDRVNNITIINNYNTTNNTTYYRGPDYKEVEQHTNTPIKPIPVASTTRPGRTKVDNQLLVYRPEIDRNASENVAPKRVRSFEEVKVERAETGTVRPPRRIQQTNAPQETIDRPANTSVDRRPVRPGRTIDANGTVAERTEVNQNNRRSTTITGAQNETSTHPARPARQERVENDRMNRQMERQERRVYNAPNGNETFPQSAPVVPRQQARPQAVERVYQPQPDRRVERPQMEPVRPAELPRQQTAPARPFESQRPIMNQPKRG